MAICLMSIKESSSDADAASCAATFAQPSASNNPINSPEPAARFERAEPSPVAFAIRFTRTSIVME